MLLNTKLQVLAKAPDLLEELLSEIPFDLLKAHRIKGKWSHSRAGSPFT